MLLYAPQDLTTADSCFEIVIHKHTVEKPKHSYSLYRGPTEADAVEKFNAFSSRLPEFAKMVKDLYNAHGLQKICDILSEHPTWNLAHLVVNFSLVELLTNPKVVEFIDYPDQNKKMTPLHLAVQSKNIEMVKALLPSVKLETVDIHDNSIFHYAANTTQEMIYLLKNRSPTTLNQRNVDGYTAMHWACLSNNPDCVNALLLAGADVNIAPYTNISEHRTPCKNKQFII